MMFSLIAAVLEQLLNKLIKLDNQFVTLLHPVIRQQLTVEVTDLSISITLLFDGNKFIVLPQGDPASNCFISADLPTLLELKQPEKVTQLIRSGKLTLEGDLHLAQQYSKAFNHIDIDWADNLSAYLGDGPAYNLVKLIKESLTHQKNKMAHSQIALTSLLQDELKVVIHPLESQLFTQDCRALQQELSQLESRINKLSQSI